MDLSAEQEIVATGRLSLTETQSSRERSLIVKECVPFSAPLPHAGRSRTAHISNPDEALSLPWIERLPGEKRIQFLHGQVFVVQHYLSCKLARAYIYRNEQFDSGSSD